MSEQALEQIAAVPEGTKVCARCKTEKLLTDFGKRGTRYFKECKECYVAQWKENFKAFRWEDKFAYGVNDKDFTDAIESHNRLMAEIRAAKLEKATNPTCSQEKIAKIESRTFRSQSIHAIRAPNRTTDFDWKLAFARVAYDLSHFPRVPKQPPFLMPDVTLWQQYMITGNCVPPAVAD